MDAQNPSKVIEVAAEIVSVYVSNNAVPRQGLAALINEVHAALQQAPGGNAEPAAEPQQPAVPIRKSVTPDYIISLENGQKFKSLKRHLMSSYGMTPDEYRAKWGLPRDYPMVAPNYAKSRSEFAKSIGLGRKGAPAPAEAPAPAVEQTPAEAAKRRRGARSAPAAVPAQAVEQTPAAGGKRRRGTKAAG